MAKRFNPEQERILNEWARTASELRRAFPYTTASETQTKGFGYLLNKEVDPDGRFYIRVRESDGSRDLDTAYTVTFNSDDFYLEYGNPPDREVIVNFAGSTGGGGSSNVSAHSDLTEPGMATGDDHPQYARKAAEWNNFLGGISAEAFYLKSGLLELRQGTFGGGDDAGSTIFGPLDISIEADRNNINSDIELAAGRNVEIAAYAGNAQLTAGNNITATATNNVSYSAGNILAFNSGGVAPTPGGSMFFQAPGTELIIGNRGARFINAVEAEAFYVTAGGNLSFDGLTVNNTQRIRLTGGRTSTGASNTFIDVPSDFMYDGQGVNVNTFLGFAFVPTVAYNSSQAVSISPAFHANQTWKETAAVGSDHTGDGFVITGFQGQPKVSVAHNGTSTGDNLNLVGIDVAPVVNRATGNTGNTKINLMAGVSTNHPFWLKFLDPTIVGNHTIDKYAHFIAFDNPTGRFGINISGTPTITEMVGIDLVNLERGDSTFSLRSNSTRAKMDHTGPVIFGDTLRVRNQTTGEAFYVNDGGEVSSGLTYVRGRFAVTDEGSFTIGADQNNYNPDSARPVGFWRINGGAANRNITGIQASLNKAQYLDIVNVGTTNTLVFAALSGSSTAANQITFNGTTCTLDPNEAAALLYDTTSSKWRIISTTGTIA